MKQCNNRILGEPISAANAKQLIDAIPREDLIRPADVANVVGAAVGEVYALIEDGTLSACNKARDQHGPPLYRIYRWSLEQFICTRIAKAPGPKRGGQTA